MQTYLDLLHLHKMAQNIHSEFLFLASIELGECLPSVRKSSIEFVLSTPHCVFTLTPFDRKIVNCNLACQTLDSYTF